MENNPGGEQKQAKLESFSLPTQNSILAIRALEVVANNRAKKPIVTFILSRVSKSTLFKIPPFWLEYSSAEDFIRGGAFGYVCNRMAMKIAPELIDIVKKFNEKFPANKPYTKTRNRDILGSVVNNTDISEEVNDWLNMIAFSVCRDYWPKYTLTYAYSIPDKFVELASELIITDKEEWLFHVKMLHQEEQYFYPCSRGYVLLALKHASIVQIVMYGDASDFKYIRENFNEYYGIDNLYERKVADKFYVKIRELSAYADFDMYNGLKSISQETYKFIKEFKPDPVIYTMLLSKVMKSFKVDGIATKVTDLSLTDQYIRFLRRFIEFMHESVPNKKRRFDIIRAFGQILCRGLFDSSVVISWLKLFNLLTHMERTNVDITCKNTIISVNTLYRFFTEPNFHEHACVIYTLTCKKSYINTEKWVRILNLHPECCKKMFDSRYYCYLVKDNEFLYALITTQQRQRVDKVTSMLHLDTIFKYY
jgi:hypothetical protein